MLGSLLLPLAVVGTATVAYLSYAVVDFLALHFLLPSRPLEAYKRRGPGPTYALVTGGSAGIGLGVAQELLRQGFAVVLLAHLEEELVETKQMLRRLVPGAEVRTVVVDARTATAAELDDVVRSLEGLDVSMLVNNVGGCAVALPPLRPVSTYSTSDVDVVVDQNARFMARLTALMLPLLSRRRRGDADERSLILNMSSAGGVGVPYLAVYGATKAFNLAFSRGVARELDASPSTSHVDCLAIVPGDVLSQGNSKGVSSLAPRWDDYGRCLVGTVDGAIRRGMRDLSPYWLHDLEQRILPWLDEGTRTREVTKAMEVKKRAWDAHLDKTR
ncbi:hypothetical protein DCS_03383 [Drechmeria coniospora]|uniref:3-ketoacyl-CoA reductase n=1 Tax=Drechmeria coniospora TaxID=98403 RepID=A0A151GH02_DRECN|nr:hypothetical protein DCS_03383 [Drechmeria coniospora]KYK56383.1 hypothetical protein DCS_03383 [Drechmeria coniospora]